MGYTGNVIFSYGFHNHDISQVDGGGGIRKIFVT